MSARPTWAAALALVFATSACGGSGSPAPTSAAPTTTEPPATSTAPSTTAPPASTTVAPTTSSLDTTTSTIAAPSANWVDLLGSIPLTPGMGSSVIINDYAAAGEAIGLAVPPDSAGEGAVVDYLLALSLGPVADPSTNTRAPGMGITDDSFGARAPHDVAAWRTAFGLAVTDVDVAVVAGVPPELLTIWRGRIDPEAVADAVVADPEWSTDLRIAEHGGESYYAWTDDPMMADPQRVSPVRPLGRGGCLYAAEGIALRAVDCSVIEAAIDARSGAGASVGEGDVATLAAALQEAGAYAAFLTADPTQFAASADAGGDSLPLHPYLAAATGAALDGDTPILLIGLLHTDAETAAANAGRLTDVATRGASLVGTPWSEMLGQGTMTVEGPLLVASFPIVQGSASLWIRLVLLRDTLVAWG